MSGDKNSRWQVLIRCASFFVKPQAAPLKETAIPRMYPSSNRMRINMDF